MAEPLPRPKIRYEPPGPVARRFMRSNAFMRGIMGPFGSGKSTACVMEILRRAQQQAKAPNGKRKSRWLIVRNTYPELKTTTIKTWHQWVPRSLGKWQSEGPPTHFLNDGDLELEVMFVALDGPDDVGKLLSMELTGAWINEAREVPKAILDGLTGRVGRYPGPLDGGCSWRGIIMDTNPPDTEHWWYMLAEKDLSTDRGRQLVESTEAAEAAMRSSGALAADQSLVEFFRQPSGFSDEAENLDWLDQSGDTLKLPIGHPERRRQGRNYYVRASAGKTEDWNKVYLRGEYGFVLEGRAVYPEYVDSVHCREFEFSRRQGLYIGLDFGLTPAAIFGQRSVMGAWRWHSELCTEGVGAIRFAEILRRTIHERYGDAPVEAITGDPAGDQRQGGDAEERTVFQLLAANGVQARPAPTNDPVKRREAVAFYLNKMIDGAPGLLIHPQCRTLRKGMAGGYHYRRLQSGDGDMVSDRPVKNAYSHPCEAGQYMLVGAGEAQTIVRRKDRPGAGPEFAISDYQIFT